MLCVCRCVCVCCACLCVCHTCISLSAQNVSFNLPFCARSLQMLRIRRVACSLCPFLPPSALCAFNLQTWLASQLELRFIAAAAASNWLLIFWWSPIKLVQHVLLHVIHGYDKVLYGTLNEQEQITHDYRIKGRSKHFPGGFSELSLQRIGVLIKVI